MRLGAIVIDSDNVEELSDFYARLLGWTKSSQIQDGEKWITVVKDDYSETPIVFQEDLNYRQPKWPSDKEEQQQMIHLDFYVCADEFESKIEHAIKCGAKMPEPQFSNNWKVMLDPSGHPFCIIPIPKDIYQQRYINIKKEDTTCKKH
ncbi:MAG: VOC family protein [Lachnospiraceae bacterium]